MTFWRRRGDSGGTPVEDLPQRTEGQERHLAFLPFVVM